MLRGWIRVARQLAAGFKQASECYTEAGFKQARADDRWLADGWLAAVCLSLRPFPQRLEG